MALIGVLKLCGTMSFRKQPLKFVRQPAPGTCAPVVLRYFFLAAVWNKFIGDSRTFLDALNNNCGLEIVLIAAVTEVCIRIVVVATLEKMLVDTVIQL
jgi:hypothetical protein